MICSFEGCKNRQYYIEVCKGHYKQLVSREELHPLKYGAGYDEWKAKVKLAEDIERFWLRVDQTGSCWEWTGTKNDAGYGRLGQGNKSTAAHRFSYMLAFGEIPEGQFVDHICHNPGCVRPDHLRLATQQQNQQNRAGANRNSKSGVRGVVPYKDGWVGIVRCDNRQHRTKTCGTVEEAGEAISALRRELMPYSTRDSF